MSDVLNHSEIYTPIQIMKVRGVGPQEAASVLVDLCVGDEIRLSTPRLGGSLGAFTVVEFEDGRNGRRPVLRAPDGDLFHMEGSFDTGAGDVLDVFRGNKEPS